MVQTANHHRSGKLQKSQQKFGVFFPEAAEPYVCSETEKAEGFFPSKTTRTPRKFNILAPEK